MRVHELAKELGTSAKELVQQLAAQGLDVSSHMSKVDDELANSLIQKAKGVGELKQPPKPKILKPKDVSENQKSEDKPKVAVAPDIDSIKALKDEMKKEEKLSRVEKSPIPKPISKKLNFEKKMSKVKISVIEEDEEEPFFQEPEEFELKSVGAKKKKKFKKKIDTDKPLMPVLETIKSNKLYIPAEIQVRILAESMDKPVAQLISKLIELGMMVTQNQNIDFDTASIVAHEFGFEVFPEEKREEEQKKEAEKEDPRLLLEKPPVVTFMGHVDHGKTSLLDYIRKAHVAANEAGQITQHIGAYETIHNGKKIVFLDTPGHKAFTAIRSRGANVTDIVVLVVAADDGIMEQTKEAISHAQAAQVPIIVAINKIDRANANVDRVFQQLTENRLMPEEWGGETICVKVSALTGEGIDHLLEMILLQSEMMELKANPYTPAKGTVIESKLTRGRGPTVTVLIQRGTLRIGDPIICDQFSGKVKSLSNDKLQNIKEAGPATPVEVLGLDGVPDAGTILEVVDTEKGAKKVAEERETSYRKKTLEQYEKPTTLEELYKKIEAEEEKELKLIIKGDVHGSLEALSHSLEDLSTEKISVKVIHKAVGDISESDVMLASASAAIILGFCIKIDKRAREVAKKEIVQIKLYNIIYEAIDDIRLAMSGMLGTKTVEHLIGYADVREVFKISKLGSIAGCMVQDGKVLKSAKVKVLRDNDTIYEGHLDSLKRFKDEVKEVRSGLECGIKVYNFNDLKIGDKLEFYTIEKVAETL